MVWKSMGEGRSTWQRRRRVEEEGGRGDETQRKKRGNRQEMGREKVNEYE